MDALEVVRGVTVEPATARADAVGVVTARGEATGPVTARTEAVPLVEPG
jgi:hypothetical protein